MARLLGYPHRRISWALVLSVIVALGILGVVAARLVSPLGHLIGWPAS